MKENGQKGIGRTKRGRLQNMMTIQTPHGKCGSYTYDDGSLYIGDFDEHGVKCGLGHLEVSQ